MSDKYLQLKSEYDELFKRKWKTFLDETVAGLMTSWPGKAYSVLKRLGSRPGDHLNDGTFVLPEHEAQGLSVQQTADKIAEHFSAISQEYEPFNIDRLPLEIKEQIVNHIDLSDLPRMDASIVWEKMKNTKVTKSVMPGKIV